MATTHDEVDRLRAALLEIWEVGDGSRKNSKENPAGTTGEGHATCRWKAYEALKGEVT